jgi:dTDP-4-dehydrorhamnose 3,5-epimerase-like enzyme
MARVSDAAAGITTERTVGTTTIPGVELAQMPAYSDARRVLVVSYEGNHAPGKLGYTVSVRPRCSVGDHYHRRREERIIVVSGPVEFRLLDRRPGLESFGEWNRFTVEEAGLSVRVPARIAHTITAGPAGAVLQVVASREYERDDDVRVLLSQIVLDDA